MSLLIGVDEVAEITGLRPATVYELTRRGTFGRGIVVKLGRSVRFNKPRLMAFLDEGGDLAAEQGGNVRPLKVGG